MAKQFRPVVVYGNDTTLYIRMKRFDKSTGEYIDFNMEQVTDLSVSLICSQHNTDIPLTFTVDGNLITCAIEYRLLHPNASYGIIVEGIDEDQKHFRFEMLSREGFLVVSNTSGMKVDDNIETIDIQGRVGWGISYNGDLTNYYTKSEVDNLIAEIEIDLSDYYTKEEINQLVNQFPTKSEIDAKFNDYYTKTQTNNLLSTKQDTLVSGSNIKTINNQSILGSGNINIQGGGGSVESIIVNYREVIPDETITKIKEQKTNVWMKIGEQYYLLTDMRTMDGWGATLTFIVPSPKSKIENGDVVDNGQIYVQIFQYFEVFKKWFNKSYTVDDHSIIENLFNEQFKTTADALWDLDHRINKNEYITNKKLESIEDSTKDTLDEFGDNINEQLSVAANTLMEHSERLAVQSDWNESDTTSLAYIQNKPTIQPQVQSDWNETDSTSLAYIQNKPTIQPQVQSDWNETDSTSLAYIQNKPTIQTQVQSDWDETDSTSLAYIQNKPTIQTQVQSDWDETDTTSLAYIQNKPNISEPGFIKVTNGNKTGLVSSLSTHYDTNIGNYATIEGDGWSNGYRNNSAQGNYSHVEGEGNQANGEAGHAEGIGTYATGYASHAEGNSTTASGYCSHSEGEQGTVASGEASHAEGYMTKASGLISHAEGHGTEASGYKSHAEGWFTQAKNQSEHASGQFNSSTLVSASSFDSTSSTGTLFSIGNGSSNTARHNALEVKMNGDIYLNDGSHPVSSTTNGLKIEVVSALPATPDANTIYVIQ